MRLVKSLTAVLLIGIALAGCSKKEASFETQEMARAQVLENAEFNARTYRAASNQPDVNIIMRGDSTVSPKCITGDGWASIDLVTKDGRQVAKLKCSTVSGTIGCMPEADFKARPQYANQDGQCNTNLPFPLPKIAK
ncbi:MAG: hypothetical protein K2X80_16185 [Pseudomonadaceae bacterium]|nr:hypothetical protein [Pseudomonadaceae bacterium]